MKRITILALFGAVLMGLSPPASAQTQFRRFTLAVDYDLDGEATDADQIVVAEDLVDSTALTIAAQPDVCRLVTLTVVDTTPSITAGDVDVVGTDCTGAAQTEVVDISSGAGTYTTTALFETITSVTPGATTTVATLGGSSDETISVGVTALTAASTQSCLYVGRNGSPMDQPFHVPIKVQTSGSSTTVSAETASTGPFTNVSVGDLVFLNAQGNVVERVVVTNADDDTITVDTAVNISTAAGFNYLNHSCGAGNDDGAIAVAQYDGWTFQLDVAQLVAASGDGVQYRVECRVAPTARWVTVLPTAGGFNVIDDADDPTQVGLLNDSEHKPWDACRLGWIFGDGTTVGADDATDTTTAAESISAYFVGRVN